MPFESLPGRLVAVEERIAAAVAAGGHGQQVTVVAITKTHGPEAAHAAWTAGLRNVGENRVQEALDKMSRVDVPVAWHLVGHLQRNKVKQVDAFALVHSLDSDRLATALNAHGLARGRPVDVLVQLNVSGERSKGGFPLEDVPATAGRLAAMAGLRVRGAMTMAPLDAPERTLRDLFAGARTARERLRAEGHPADVLSMGMSGDYEVAVEEGATMVRLGTVLFGARAT
jgi:pyridoxal phosphate enzyme (YggS family)